MWLEELAEMFLQSSIKSLFSHDFIDFLLYQTCFDNWRISLVLTHTMSWAVWTFIRCVNITDKPMITHELINKTFCFWYFLCSITRSEFIMNCRHRCEWSRGSKSSKWKRIWASDCFPRNELWNPDSSTQTGLMILRKTIRFSGLTGDKQVITASWWDMCSWF